MRYLDDPNLLLWFAQRGAGLHESIARLIRFELERLAQLELAKDTTELTRIRVSAPFAIPRDQMRMLWLLMLSGHVKSRERDWDLHQWITTLKRFGLSPSLRLQLRSLLAPRILLKRPVIWGQEAEKETGDISLRSIVDWELVLASDGVRYSLEELAALDLWRANLPELLDDFQQLLRDALDLERELGGASDRDDRSYWDLPSIREHWQNRYARDWVVLIELLRNAWSALRDRDPVRAIRVARVWFDVPYLTFKRLAFFAASFDGCIESEVWVNWLLADDTWWLWSVGSQREVMRLFVLQGHQLSTNARNRLEAAILTGPPGSMYRKDVDPGEVLKLSTHASWLRLAKLRLSGGNLGADATERLEALTKANPDWRLADNESDEFSHWMSGTGDPDFELSLEVRLAPRTRRALYSWVLEPDAQEGSLRGDNWQEVCRTRFYHCALALCDLARDGKWPVARWSAALQVWGEEGMVARSWGFLAPLVNMMPSEVLGELAHSVAWWLEAASKASDRHESVTLDLAKRMMLQPSLDAGPLDEPVTRAINHPLGHATQALLNLWFKRKPSDNDGLPQELKPVFTALCDSGVTKLRHGRVLLASRLIALFRVDQTWTEINLLPLMDWDMAPLEASPMWEGFLWSPRLYGPLLIAFKKQFLGTARHYSALGEHASQFAALLTYAALAESETYPPREFQAALGQLPQEGLDESARALFQALEGAGEQREIYWTNRVLPFWKGCWPKDLRLASTSISQSVARLAIAARREFPSAVELLAGWFSPIDHPHAVIHRLRESGLADQYPHDALTLLDGIVSEESFESTDLGACLAAIANAAPELVDDGRYKRLEEYRRRHGI